RFCNFCRIAKPSISVKSYSGGGVIQKSKDIHYVAGVGAFRLDHRQCRKSVLEEFGVFVSQRENGNPSSERKERVEFVQRYGRCEFSPLRFGKGTESLARLANLSIEV